MKIEIIFIATEESKLNLLRSSVEYKLELSKNWKSPFKICRNKLEIENTISMF